jgi:hypothetical protein
VVVVLARELVANPAVTQRNLRDDAALLEPPDGTEHRRVIGRHARREKTCVEILDRPVVPFVALDQATN